MASTPPALSLLLSTTGEEDDVLDDESEEDAHTSASDRYFREPFGILACHGPPVFYGFSILRGSSG